MSSTLKRICVDKLEYVVARKHQVPLKRLEALAKAASPLRGFAAKLKRAAPYGLITEIKRASPSAGVIRDDFVPEDLAKSYEQGGATCLSVLTDKLYFRGHDDYLLQARAACALPVLRKDFMLDPYQIIESRMIGADCVLLIMAALSDGQAQELYATATEWGLDVLVEVHDEKELDRALDLKAEMIGINNRNLKTLEVDLTTTIKLAPRIPSDCLVVSESGLSTEKDLAFIKKETGITTFLIGESLMRQDDVKGAVQDLLS